MAKELHTDHDGHTHNHTVSVAQAASSAFKIGIVLNMVYVLAELIAGFATGSLALITDAGHNFSDVISLALSLLAFRLAKVKPSKTFTYGYKKSTILAALINAAILLIAIGVLGFESFMRLGHPQPVAGGIIAWVAGIGIVINAVSAYLFNRSQKHELNARGAYLHLIADALVSAAVVVSGIIISFTHWYWLDAVMSLVVLVVILVSTWSLLTDSLRLSLDAVPRNVDMTEVESIIKKVQGVESVRHIHVWAMSTTENALTAHLQLPNTVTNEEQQQILKNVRHELLHCNISHATLEVEVIT